MACGRETTCELNLFVGMDKRTTHFFKTSLFQIDNQKNVDDRGDAEDNQKVLMPGLVSEYLHAQQTANRAAKNTQDQQDAFRDAATVNFGLHFVVTHQ